MFAKRLRELRKRYDLTQVEIAELVGLSHQAVGKWERGEATPDFDALKKLSARFNCSIDYLIKGTEPPKTEPPSMQPLTSDEESLIKFFRFTDEWGRGTILETAEREAKRVAYSTGKVLKVAT